MSFVSDSEYRVATGNSFLCSSGYMSNVNVGERGGGGGGGRGDRVLSTLLVCLGLYSDEPLIVKMVKVKVSNPITGLDRR